MKKRMPIAQVHLIQGYFHAMFLPPFISCAVVLEGPYMWCFMCLDQNATCKPNYNFCSS